MLPTISKAPVGSHCSLSGCLNVAPSKVEATINLKVFGVTKSQKIDVFVCDPCRVQLAHLLGEGPV